MLGASGAISGVMAWWCIECFKRGHSLVMNGMTVSPLLFWALYVAIDLSGLMRLGKAQQVLTALLHRMAGHEGKAQDGGTADKNRVAQVGYDAHIGGAIAGLVWQAPSLLMRQRR